MGRRCEITVPARKRAAVLEGDALAGNDLGDGDPAGENRAGVLRGVGDREADHPHAALDVSPKRPLASHVALEVHELDRGRARVLRPTPGADDPLAEEGGLEALVGHVVVEHVGDRSLEDEVDHRAVGAEELLDLGPGRRLAHPGVPLALAQLAPDLVEQLLVGPVAVDVGRGDAQFLQVGLGARVVEPLPECGAVVEGHPEVGIGHPVAKAAPLELELPDQRGRRATPPRRHTG